MYYGQWTYEPLVQLASCDLVGKSYDMVQCSITDEVGTLSAKYIYQN